MALIGVSGAFLYNKLKSVCGPAGTSNRKYSEVKPLIKNALSPKSLEVVERAKFYSRHQNGGETAAAFALALRQLAQLCNFGEQLDSHLRDRFIMGLENEEMKRVIIRSNPDTFDKAISIAQTTELSNDVGNQVSIHEEVLHVVQRTIVILAITRTFIVSIHEEVLHVVALCRMVVDTIAEEVGTCLGDLVVFTVVIKIVDTDLEDAMNVDHGNIIRMNVQDS